MTAMVPGKPVPSYGWTGEGKTAAEISSDIEQTRYRLDADVRALSTQLSKAKRLIPIAAAAVAGLTLLIRRIRRRR